MSSTLTAKIYGTSTVYRILNSENEQYGNSTKGSKNVSTNCWSLITPNCTTEQITYIALVYFMS